MAVHGVPRATGDIDLWVRPSRENAEKVFRALARYGAPIASLTLDDLSKPGTVFQIGVAPHRIDVLTAIDGVAFEEAWAHRITTDISGVKVPVIGREDLVRNKRSTGRTRDQADADRLENPE